MGEIIVQLHALYLMNEAFQPNHGVFGEYVKIDQWVCLTVLFVNERKAI